MTYEEWELGVPDAFKKDSLWNVEAYRLAVFLKELAWPDVTKLSEDRRTRGLVDQLFRAIGSISANISEGYSRTTGKERARFYEYALGSAREARDWYHQGQYILNKKVTNHRIDLATGVIRLLLTMIPDQRRSNRKLSESPSRNHVIT